MSTLPRSLRRLLLLRRLRPHRHWKPNPNDGDAARSLGLPPPSSTSPSTRTQPVRSASSAAEPVGRPIEDGLAPAILKNWSGQRFQKNRFPVRDLAQRRSVVPKNGVEINDAAILACNNQPGGAGPILAWKLERLVLEGDGGLDFQLKGKMQRRDLVAVAEKASRLEREAAVAMCVGMGSFSDPFEAQGLAHFLEHMLFMGSTDFPDENEENYPWKFGEIQPKGLILPAAACKYQTVEDLVVELEFRTFEQE